MSASIRLGAGPVRRRRLVAGGGAGPARAEFEDDVVAALADATGGRNTVAWITWVPSVRLQDRLKPLAAAAGGRAGRSGA